MYNRSYKGINLDGLPIEVTVKGQQIVSVRRIAEEPGLPYLLPSLVDLQQNGALGFAYNNMKTPDAPIQLQKIGDYLIRNGVGRVLATFTTAPYDLLENAATAINLALNEHHELNKLFFGIFHEGVFISSQPGWRGGHDPAYIMPPDWQRFKRLDELSGNRVKMVNVAPEEPGALDFIATATTHGLKTSIGHSCANTSIITEAVKRGASMVTHFGNGAAPLIHRFNNPFWGLLDNPKLSLGLIGDGFHLPPELIRVVLRCKGINKCFMVSDANIYSGCAPGRYQRLGGTDCVIEKNGFIHVPDQDILAGAWFQNNHSIEFLVNQVGMEFKNAWRLCSQIPADLMNIPLPRLQTNDEATFVQATFSNGCLKIHQSVFNGKEYIKQETPSEIMETHAH